CRWLPMHSGQKFDAGVDGQSDGMNGLRPASGPWCYTNGPISVNDETPSFIPTRCLPHCGKDGEYKTEREKPHAPHKPIVPGLKINHNPEFSERLGSIFNVDGKQKKMIYVKPSMEDHHDELLEQKKIVFYSCCGVVGAVILWITVCHFLGKHVRKRRLAIVEIQRQAINADITRRRRESEQERQEENDARAKTPDA
ncbi:hypothetical protein PFISCL1PPCAC_21732, partial [Pristionchus fissidentatus]